MFSKHLHLCFFKLKYPSTINISQSSSPPSITPNNSTIFHFNTTFTNSNSNCNSMDYADDVPPPPPDLASVMASQRFFFSSPGTSNSIIDSSDSHNNNNNNNNRLQIPKGGVRVPKYSLNPYVDFLRSMHEMIDSQQMSLDWDYLHQLLLCYLALNPIHTHKFIVHAFTDLVVDLLSLSSSFSFSFSSSSSLSSSSPPPPAVKTEHQVQAPL